MVSAGDRLEVVAKGIDDAVLPGVTEAEIVATFRRLAGAAAAG